MQHTIHFLPDDIEVQAETGDNLLTVAANAGIFIRAACGGDGVCRKCTIQLVAGELHNRGRSPLTPQEQASGMHLACTASIVANATVRIPEMLQADGRSLRARPKTTHSISARSMTGLLGDWAIDPPVRKLFMQLPPPTIDDNIPDMQRLIREYQRLQPGRQEPEYDHPEFLLELADTLREANWQVTIIILEGKRENDRERIIAVEPGDTTGQLYGLALDIGTTTMSGALIDLNSGEVIAEDSKYNRQIGHGEDVIARMIYAMKPHGRKTLQNAAVKTINEIVEAVCRQVIINPSDISFIMAAGNTVMTHLLLGINPRFIRQAPYVPSLSTIPLTKAAHLGIMAHPSVRLFLYPCIASYVGGDIVAGVHACQMHRSQEICLFIDIGTNGEIVIGNSSWMLCAACSAGPAFEGGGIKFGMRASNGAVENIHIHPVTLEPMIVTVGNINPRGICGSGLIAIVAELLDAGIIDSRGKFTGNHNHPRIRQGEDGWEYVIAWAEDSQIDQDIVITEIDLENLIRAKGAMFAGYQTLLDSVGIAFADIDKLILAGNFGAHIDIERAIAIGLLPDIDRGKFYFLGNASLLGCQISLTDHNRWRQRLAVRSIMTNTELSERAEFMHHYMAALFLPHTDATLFPSRSSPGDRTRG
ncbi:MAG: ASKHA domain-containing protein [Desulfopila sp.]